MGFSRWGTVQCYDEGEGGHPFALTSHGSTLLGLLWNLAGGGFQPHDAQSRWHCQVIKKQAAPVPPSLPTANMLLWEYLPASLRLCCKVSWNPYTDMSLMHMWLADGGSTACGGIH